MLFYYSRFVSIVVASAQSVTRGGVSPLAAWLAFALMMVMFGGVVVPAVWHPRAANRRAAVAVLDRIISGVIDIIRALRPSR